VKNLRDLLANYYPRGSRPEKNGLLDNQNRGHPCGMSAKRRNVWNDEKSDPTNGVMNDVKSPDLAAIHSDVSGGDCAHVLQASSF
jgi:hypothetical protein